MTVMTDLPATPVRDAARMRRVAALLDVDGAWIRTTGEAATSAARPPALPVGRSSISATG